jgi:hypothetical protein
VWWFEALCSLDSRRHVNHILSDTIFWPSFRINALEVKMKVKVKVKVKFALVQAVKAENGRIGIALLFL